MRANLHRMARTPRTGSVILPLLTGLALAAGCASSAAAAPEVAAPEIYALNCMGCHPGRPETTGDLHVSGVYAAQFREDPDKRRFFIRMPSQRSKPLSRTQNRELLDEILSWAKACPQLPPGTPLKLPGSQPMAVK